MRFGTVHGPHNLSKHGHEDAESALTVLHNFQGKSGKAISKILMCSFIMMNSDEDHQEHNNILGFSKEHNNILNFRMFIQNFK